MRAWNWIRLVATTLIVFFGVACSANSTNVGRQPGGGGASGGNGGSGGSGTGVGGGSGSGTVLLDGGTECKNTCSTDLTEVLDCDGNVVQECIDGQGCAFGACTGDPCEAAAKSKSTYGCDYWALKTDVIFQLQGACFAMFIANTWSEPVHIRAEWRGQELPASAIKIPQGQGFNLTYADYNPSQGLPVGEVAVLFLARATPLIPLIPDCPVPAAVTEQSGVTGTGRGDAFHVTTDKPVVAYQMLPYGGGAAAMTAATLLLPTGSWDTNYVAVNAYGKSTIANGQPTMAVLASEDGTEVTILPKANVLGGAGVTGGPAGAPLVFNLDRGQYAQFTQDDELTGSPIVSNKPVAVFGGSSCANIPADVEACDIASQQIPPVRALGHEYVAVRHRNRTGLNETVPWRMVGAVDGTELTWTPSAPPGAPSTLATGELAEFETSERFVVHSQGDTHPFYLSSYMTGGEPLGGVGDPEWVNVIPPQQYLERYVLFTDPTYSDTNLVVTRKPREDGTFSDVSLGCAGALSGWTPVGDYEYTYVDLVTGNFANVGNCSNGRHEMWSDTPFGVTVWGWGSIPGILGSTQVFTQYVSYAYPAGAGVKPINEVYVPPIPK